MERKIKIALTMGCPKGVGPELVVSADRKLADKCEITTYGDRETLRRVEGNSSGRDISKLTDSECGRLSFDALSVALKDVLSGKQDALVTAPINKYHWKQADIPYIGHTEFLTENTGSQQCAMMMVSPQLKVTLATIHEPLKDVAQKISEDKIISAGQLTNRALKDYFGVVSPRIAVAALNPHCGDRGLLGDEEERIIEPAINRLKKAGVLAAGPFPADSVFSQAADGKYDAVIAMYHDQGLAAIKTLDYKHTVNITLGIPIIRTSVDHGTAEDIAWKRIADDTNLIAAIEMAIHMVKKST